MPKISNEQKLSEIKHFLRENNIEWIDNYHHKAGVVIPCYIPKHRIGIHIGDNQGFFELSKRNFYPVFIRKEDTKAFVLEKVQNTIIKSMKAQQALLNKKHYKKHHGKG